MKRTVTNNTSSQKRALTREVKQLQEHYDTLAGLKDKQGDQYYYTFEGRKCERYIHLGEFVLPRHIRQAKRELDEAKAKREALNNN